MTNLFKNLLQNDNLLVGISELSKMTEVSPRQLRYWEQKGLIASVPQPEDNAARKYRLPVVVKVELIKKFLDEGYTLTKAVEKAEEKIRIAHHVRCVFSKVLKDIEVIDERFTVISIGPVDTLKQNLYVIHDEKNGSLSYKLLPQGEQLDTSRLDQLTDE